MSERNNKVSIEEEIKTEAANAGDIYRVKVKVNVEVQLWKFNEKDSCRHLVHGLRMIDIHSRVRI